MVVMSVESLRGRLNRVGKVMQAYFNSKLGHASKVFLEEKKRYNIKCEYSCIFINSFIGIWRERVFFGVVAIRQQTEERVEELILNICRQLINIPFFFTNYCVLHISYMYVQYMCMYVCLWQMVWWWLSVISSGLQFKVSGSSPS